MKNQEVKKPLSAFLQYHMDKLKELKEQDQALPSNVTSLISNQWKNLDQEQKQVYENKYKQQMQAFLEQKQNQTGNVKPQKKLLKLSNIEYKEAIPQDINSNENQVENKNNENNISQEYEEAEIEVRNNSVSSSSVDSFDDYMKELKEQLNIETNNALQLAPIKIPINPFMRFHLEKFNYYKAKYPRLQTQNITKIIKNEWDNISQARKQPYIDSYVNDKKKYENLKIQCESVNQKPKKPATPFLRFHSQMLGVYKKKYPKLTHNDITKMISRDWINFDNYKKRELEIEYVRDKAAYKEQVQSFDVNKVSYVLSEKLKDQIEMYQKDLLEEIDQFRQKYPKPLGKAKIKRDKYREALSLDRQRQQMKMQQQLNKQKQQQQQQQMEIEKENDMEDEQDEQEEQEEQEQHQQQQQQDDQNNRDQNKEQELKEKQAIIERNDKNEQIQQKKVSQENKQKYQNQQAQNNFNNKNNQSGIQNKKQQMIRQTNSQNQLKKQIENQNLNHQQLNRLNQNKKKEIDSEQQMEEEKVPNNDNKIQNRDQVNSRKNSSSSSRSNSKIIKQKLQNKQMHIQKQQQQQQQQQQPLLKQLRERKFLKSYRTLNLENINSSQKIVNVPSEEQQSQQRQQQKQDKKKFENSEEKPVKKDEKEEEDDDDEDIENQQPTVIKLMPVQNDDNSHDKHSQKQQQQQRGRRRRKSIESYSSEQQSIKQNSSRNQSRNALNNSESKKSSSKASKSIPPIKISESATKVLQNSKPEIENIIGMRQENEAKYYLVRWKDQGPEHNTWEPKEKLKKYQNLINYFEQLYLPENQIKQNQEPQKQKKQLKVKKNNSKKDEKKQWSVTKKIKKDYISRLRPTTRKSNENKIHYKQKKENKFIKKLKQNQRTNKKY